MCQEAGHNGDSNDCGEDLSFVYYEVQVSV